MVQWLSSLVTSILIYQVYNCAVVAWSHRPGFFQVIRCARVTLLLRIKAILVLFLIVSL